MHLGLSKTAGFATTSRMMVARVLLHQQLQLAPKTCRTPIKALLKLLLLQPSAQQQRLLGPTIQRVDVRRGLMLLALTALPQKPQVCMTGMTQRSTRHAG
jgi:hypothetical protein